ncbi:MAG: hypothetical protein ACRD1E_07150, partial [Terriglobales bacterium]
TASNGVQSANAGLPNAAIQGVALNAAGATAALEAIGVAGGSAAATSIWSTAATGARFGALATDPAQAGSLFALAPADGTVWRSTDAGATWSRFGSAENATALVASLSGLWLGTGSGTLTAPSGALKTLPAAVSALAAAASGDAAWAAAGGQVWRTSDGGQTWAAAATLPGAIVALALDPVRAALLAAATAQAVFLSFDGGSSWVPAPAGLSAAPLSALAIDSNEILWAATLGRGLWQLPLAGVADRLQLALPASAPVNSTVAVQISASAMGSPQAKAAFSMDASIGGTLFWSGAAVTDASGNATVTIPLPQRAGTVAITAALTGAVPSVNAGAALQATALAAASLSLISGAGQQAPSGQTLPQPIVVLAADPYGNPVAGVPVSFAGGNFSSTSVASGSNGEASVMFTLPPQPGTITLTASAPGIAASIAPIQWTEAATGAPDYALSLTAPAVAGPPNQNASLVLQVAARYGFAAAVAVRCVAPISGCAVSPALLSPGQSATVVVNPALAGNQASMQVEVEADAQHMASAVLP